MSTTTLTPWQSVRLTEDGEAFWSYAPGDEDFIEKLDEYRRTGSLHGHFLEMLPGQDPERAWVWGEKPEEIDWTGFPEVAA